ncbi:Uncharacterised protein [Edwardsiella tarda]|nr:Uncharacterised protein [Edwardsiella tarda]
MNGAQIDDGHAEDVFQQTLTDITYVGRTLFQVFIVQLFQRGSLAVDHLAGGGFGTHAVIFNQGYDFLLKLFIFQQHDVPFEDRRFLFTESLAGFLTNGFQLLCGLVAALFEAGDLVLDFVGSDLLTADDNLVFFEKKRLTKSDAR